MPLVAHNTLPTFERLRRDGITVLSTERAANQEIRELHVGLLNMMPDAALEATERQFYRLVGESNPIAQFYMHPFTLPTLPRGEAAQSHIAQYHESFDAIRENRFYVVTHPKILSSVELRLQDIAAQRNPSDPFTFKKDVAVKKL